MMMNNTCVAFGEFEFVHRGHKRIVETVVDIAKERNLTSVIVSLEKEGKVFTTEEEREYLLKKMGVEMVLSFGTVKVEELMQIMAAKVIVIGEEDKEAERILQAAQMHGIEVVVVPSVKTQDRKVTTAWVKEAFEACDFELVTELCGHPYLMIGEVVHGKKLGRTEKMPTANIEIAECKQMPNYAVYGARINLGTENLLAVVNVGRRPTVDNYRYATIEAWIMDFEREIYGEKLVLEVHKFVRGIRKFQSLAEVKEQVDKDAKEVKKFFGL